MAMVAGLPVGCQAAVPAAKVLDPFAMEVPGVAPTLYPSRRNGHGLALLVSSPPHQLHVCWMPLLEPLRSWQVGLC